MEILAVWWTGRPSKGVSALECWTRGWVGRSAAGKGAPGIYKLPGVKFFGQSSWNPPTIFQIRYVFIQKWYVFFTLLYSC